MAKFFRAPPAWTDFIAQEWLWDSQLVSSDRRTTADALVVWADKFTRGAPRRIAVNIARLLPYFLAGSSTFPDFGLTR